MAKTSKKTTKKDPKNTGSGSGGRPPGATNIERPTAVAVRAHCPKCNSTKYTTHRGSRRIVRQISGKSLLTGELYTHVVWTNVVCECGQHFRVREETTHDPTEVDK